jgi:hypothetical protein
MNTRKLIILDCVHLALSEMHLTGRTGVETLIRFTLGYGHSSKLTRQEIEEVIYNTIAKLLD